VIDSLVVEMTTEEAATANSAADAPTGTRSGLVVDDAKQGARNSSANSVAACPRQQEAEGEGRAAKEETSSGHSISLDEAVAAPVEGSTGADEEETGGNNDGTSPSTAATTTAEATAKLSKKQLKRQRRWERAMEVKDRKKRQKKEVQLAKAKAEGRDLEQERRVQLQHQRSGVGWRKRYDKWVRDKLPRAESSFEVCLDCSFEPSMTYKEINSLAMQIRYCYGTNRRNPYPCKLAVTSMAGAKCASAATAADAGDRGDDKGQIDNDGDVNSSTKVDSSNNNHNTNGDKRCETLKILHNVSGFDEWSRFAFTCTPQSVEDYYGERGRMKDVVYLTSDSPNTLQETDDGKVYVIGGIVDRNRLKRAALTRAERIGVATARLPIDEHLARMSATRVLTCNHVFEILLKYREYRAGHDSGSDCWKRALMDVLPHRKDAKFVEDERRDDDCKVETDNSKAQAVSIKVDGADSSDTQEK